MSELTAIDLFCGAGGLSEGFHQAGFHVLAGNDASDVAGATFAKTHPQARFLGGPVQNVSVADLRRASGIGSGRPKIIVGGPPCQGYSVYNHQRGMQDTRSSLYLEYLRIVAGLLPDWVVLENVTGITSAGGGEALQAILRGLDSLGYRVETQVLRAEDYGVPQERRRFIFIGNRIGAAIVWPRKSHGGGRPFVTVRDAIGDLPAVGNGEDGGVLPYARGPRGEFQERMREGSDAVTSHAAPRLALVNLLRMKNIPPGGSWRDLPHELLPAGMKRAHRSDHTKRYGRLRWDGLASTILTKCDPHWGAFFHPEQDRAITVREAARFQSFPDRFEFQGSRTEQYIQIGNAVPPLLGLRLAEALKVSMAGQQALEAAE